MDDEKGARPAGFVGARRLCLCGASFFPIPPDVMLLPMMVANKKRAFHLAVWCALFSVIGGCFGYLIGRVFLTPSAS